MAEHRDGVGETAWREPMAQDAEMAAQGGRKLLAKRLAAGRAPFRAPLRGWTFLAALGEQFRDADRALVERHSGKLEEAGVVHFQLQT